MKNIAITIMVAAMASSLGAGVPPSELAKRQARSVHLQYGRIEHGADAIQGTTRVTETQTNTYYCILSWNTGYCGIQDKGADGKILIFSLWEPSDPFDFSARPEDVKEDFRAKVLYAAPRVDVARFGGEGTGARTMTKIDWEVGEPVTVKIESSPDSVHPDRAVYTCYWKEPKTGAFLKLASISTLHKLKPGEGGINGLYSFVEDFWRNYYSATISRRAEFFDIAYLPHGGSDWVPVTSARFTADRTPSAAIDAGRTAKGAFFLQTGGATTNSHAKLYEAINLVRKQ